MVYSQDESITTDWRKTEPCACTNTAGASAADAWWTADFGYGEYTVTKVRILSRYGGWASSYNVNYDYLRGVEVYIGDTLCG